MKKKSLYFWGATFISAVAFSFASCSQEDDFIIDNGLDIDSQVPLTRSGIDIEPGVNDLSWEDDDCCLIALVRSKQKSMPGGRFTNNYTAKMCYTDLRNKAISLEAKNHPNDPKKYNGEGAMPTDLFEDIGIQEGILNGQVSNKDSILTHSSDNTNLVVKIRVKNEMHVGRVTDRKYKKDEDGNDVIDQVKVDMGDRSEWKNASEILTVWN